LKVNHFHVLTYRTRANKGRSQLVNTPDLVKGLKSGKFFGLFVYADGKKRQIKAAALAKRVSRSRDLAARPRTILLFFNPLIFLRGLGEGKAGKKA
jgi:hypothetical protein